MLTPGQLLRRLRALLSMRRLDDELTEELRFHQDMEIAAAMRAGMDEQSAREHAQRKLGGSHFRDEARDARGVRVLEDFLFDVRFALRSLSKRRTYAAAAILTLAIGIGAMSALAAALYHVTLKPLPFPDAHRIVAVFQYDPRSPAGNEPFAPANFLDLRERSRSFDLLAAAEPWSVDWVGPGGPERLEAALVTADAFPLQGLRPLLGRVFAPDEFQPGTDGVAVISESLWRSRFNADLSLIGRTVILDNLPRVVVGVVPDDALQPYGSDNWIAWGVPQVWLPKVPEPHELTARGSSYWEVMARLAPGVTLAQAQAELATIASQLAQDHAATNGNTGFRAVSLRQAMSGSARAQLVILAGAVAFVLLIACVNVANLQLAETIRREGELAIRTAIGAGRGRIVRQLLAENLVLAAAGAVAGLALAVSVIVALRAFAPDHLWQLRGLRFDHVVLISAGVLSLACAGLVGLVPVLTAGRIRLADALASGRRPGGGRTRRRANRTLVATEIALALVLLIGAGLLARSLAALLDVDRGFRTDRLLITTLQAWDYYPTGPERAEYVRQITARLAGLPGVSDAATTSSLPFSHAIGFERARVQVEGRPVTAADELPPARAAAISPDYFDVMGIPLVRGRVFEARDAAGSVPVAIVNRSFARRFLDGEEPLGKRVVFGFMSGPVAREIVGVVGDVRHDGLDTEPPPGIFVPHPQAPSGAIHIVVRTQSDPRMLQPGVRAELIATNGLMPVSEMVTMDELLARSLRERRLQLALLAAFSLTALLLSAVGIYGVMSRAAAERTHEIGVRLALGAQPRDVRWMMLWDAGTTAAMGIVAGGAAAVLLTRFLTGMLYEIEPVDPLTYVAAAVVLLASGLVATLLPAWRASAVDPAIALRAE